MPANGDPFRTGDRVRHSYDQALGTVIGPAATPGFYLVHWDDPDIMATSSAASSLRPEPKHSGTQPWKGIEQ